MIDSQKTAADVKQTTLEALEAQDESFAFQESDLGIMPGTASQHSRTQPNNDVVLRIECITDRQMKVALGVTFVADILATVALFTEFSLKITESQDNWPGTSQDSAIANVVLGGLCLVLLVWMAILWMKRFLASRAGTCWKHRRQRMCILVGAEVAVQTVNLVAFLIPNAAILYSPCSNANQLLITMCVLVRWTCWNTLFLLICVHAQNVNPWRSKGSAKRETESAERLGMDGPWSLHATKLILWVGMEVVVAAAIWVWLADANEVEPVNISRCFDTAWICHTSARVQVTTSLIVASGMAWFALWLFLIYSGKRYLYGVPYTDFKVANMFLRLQERGRWIFIVQFSLSFALLWWVKTQSCASVAFTWLGLLPAQILASLNISAWTYMMLPVASGQPNQTLQVWLQDFAWTCEQHGQLQQDRQRHAPQHEPPPPLFCMQTAFAALYWSGLVYDSHEAEGMEAKMGWGYELLGLEQHELLWEHRLDTKILLGWGPGGIAIAFRGTASLANALSDLRVWRTDHPPARGSLLMHSRPVVHSGFLRCWLADGLQQRVIQRVLEVAAAWQAAQPGRPAPVLLTGHSLGGALSELAAYDIAKAAAEAGLQLRLSCYTFGGPRVGNHAFAVDHAQTCPDTWNVINDQDVVARRGKLWVLYKRSGHRVIINTRGDLIVRPTYAEANVQRVPGGGSLSHHYLGSYQRALLAVCLAQFSAKRYREGMQGVMDLAAAAQPMEALFRQELNLTPAEMRELARASEAAPEKWTHVQRKQLGRKGRLRGNWRDAAAAASLASSSRGTSHGSSRSSSTSLLTAPTSALCARIQPSVVDQSPPVPGISASDAHAIHAPASKHQRHVLEAGQDLPGCTDASIPCEIPQKHSVGTDAGSTTGDVAISILADDAQVPSGKHQQQQQQPLQIAGSLQSRPEPQDSGFRSRISGFVRQAIGIGPAVKH